MDPVTVASNGNGVGDIFDATISRLNALESDLEGPKEKRDSKRVREILHEGLDVLSDLPQKIQKVGDPLSELVLPEVSALADLAKSTAETLRKYPDDFTLLPIYLMGARGFPVEEVVAIRSKIDSKK